jgi:hypothetical protein
MASNAKTLAEIFGSIVSVNIRSPNGLLKNDFGVRRLVAALDLEQSKLRILAIPA